MIEGATSALAKTKSGNVLAIKGALHIDRENDLVLLAVEGKNLPFLTLGRSELLQTGDHIAVIGSPLGLVGSLSEGIVSAKRRATERAREWLQISAPISPGSSGSPVLEATGKVIGVATMSAPDGQSLNFAVPAELVAAMLSTARHQKPSAPIPLQVIARANAFDVAAAELAVLQSPEYGEADSALWSAVFAAKHNSVRQKLGQEAVESASSAAGAAANFATLSKSSLGGYKESDWGKPLDAAKALVAKYPDSSIAHEKLGGVCERMGFSAEAIEAYQRAVKLNPANDGCWESLGSIYKEKGDLTQADFAFSQAIAYRQKRVESAAPGERRSNSLARLADSYHATGNNEAAKQSYFQAIQEDPNSLGATLSRLPLADIYLSEGNEKAAFDLEYQVVASQPNPEAEAWRHLADWYFDHHRDEDGYRCFLNATNLGSHR